MDKRGEDRILRLLEAQRRATASRLLLERDSEAWDRATDAIDTVNDQLWSAALGRPPQREDLGYAIEAELDSSPEEDLAFRFAAVDALRRAVKSVALARLTEATAERLSTSEQAQIDSLRSLELAQATLRRQYAHASLAGDWGPPTNLEIRADRDGAVA